MRSGRLQAKKGQLCIFSVILVVIWSANYGNILLLFSSLFSTTVSIAGLDINPASTCPSRQRTPPLLTDRSQYRRSPFSNLPGSLQASQCTLSVAISLPHLRSRPPSRPLGNSPNVQPRRPSSPSRHAPSNPCLDRHDSNLLFLTHFTTYIVGTAPRLLVGPHRRVPRLLSGTDSFWTVCSTVILLLRTESHPWWVKQKNLLTQAAYTLSANGPRRRVLPYQPGHPGGTLVANHETKPKVHHILVGWWCSAPVLQPLRIIPLPSVLFDTGAPVSPCRPTMFPIPPHFLLSPYTTYLLSRAAPWQTLNLKNPIRVEPYLAFLPPRCFALPKTT